MMYTVSFFSVNIIVLKCPVHLYLDLYNVFNIVYFLNHFPVLIFYYFSVFFIINFSEYISITFLCLSVVNLYCIVFFKLIFNQSYSLYLPILYNFVQ